MVEPQAFGRPSSPIAVPAGIPNNSSPLQLENPQRIEIAVEDSRPLATAARELRSKLGISISYEDARWINSGDLMKASGPLGSIDPLSTSPWVLAERFAGIRASLLG